MIILNKTDPSRLDNTKFNQFVDAFIQSVQTVIKDYMLSYKFDETYYGMITADLGNDTYKVMINNSEYTVKCKTRKLQKGTPEWVTVPRGNWKDLFIR